MLKVFKKKMILYFGCVLSILFGAFIYAVFREDTYIYKTIESYIDLSRVKDHCAILDNDFTKYYLPDYLWAFSLCCGVFIILKPQNIKEVFFYSLISFGLGGTYEVLQKINVISGTCDAIDIFFYFLAALTVSSFYIILYIKGKLL